MAKTSVTAKVPPTGTGYQKLFAAALGTDYVVQSERRFHKTRLWRLDLTITKRCIDCEAIRRKQAEPFGHPCVENHSYGRFLEIAVEVDGALYQQGRHSRGAGREADMEKDAEAAIAGFTVLHVSPRHIKSGQAFRWIERVAAGRPSAPK